MSHDITHSHIPKTYTIMTIRKEERLSHTSHIASDVISAPVIGERLGVYFMLSYFLSLSRCKYTKFI